MDDKIFSVLRECANEIGEAVTKNQHLGFSGLRDTQYHLDVVADEVAIRVLGGAGFRIVSEESGVSGHGPFTVVVDPIDGSTNCDKGIPFYATSLAVMQNDELIAGLVMNQATGTVFEAQLGAGATRDGERIKVSGQSEVAQSIMAFSGLPNRHFGWSQFRALGAASLEICLVADGSLDAYSVANHSMLNPWDYLAGLLVLREAGGVAADYDNNNLETSDAVRRRPVFCASTDLLEFMLGSGIAQN